MGWTKLVEDDGTEVGVTGDSVWDLCDNFVQGLKQIYRKEVGREINKEEIKEILHDIALEFNIIGSSGVGEAGKVFNTDWNLVAKLIGDTFPEIP